MPKLSQLAFLSEMDATLVIDKDGAKPFHQNGTAPPPDAIHVTFRPRYYTRELEAQYAQDLLEKGVCAAIITRFLKVIKMWDVTDEKGKVIPLEEEALRPISTRLLDEIVAGCNAAAAPNPASSNG